MVRPLKTIVCEQEMVLATHMCEESLLIRRRRLCICIPCGGQHGGLVQGARRPQCCHRRWAEHGALGNCMVLVAHNFEVRLGANLLHALSIALAILTGERLQLP
eukprot:gnl/MRDRNA2_/MRDRNA2_84944_c0_seq5.p1 gnl/MRDRNA2_/MRDRNA2_84944_c0~~gnl/MRDRNA2_/MRDRNA2_84944_c0_seq5.p1  ORF type:complete len:104 (+),score=5.68 gnl/MRDRNA2_/MRDRNA2_84944_c0_seq5:449-760(+)